MRMLTLVQAIVDTTNFVVSLSRRVELELNSTRFENTFETRINSKRRVDTSSLGPAAPRIHRKPARWPSSCRAFCCTIDSDS